MVQVQDITSAAELLEPRRIMRYVLVYCSSGSLIMAVDEKEYLLTTNSVITITSGQIHQLKKNHNARGWVLEFSFDFFVKNDNDLELIFHNSMFCHFAMNEVIHLGNTQLVNDELKEIGKEMDAQPYKYLVSVHSRIELVLVGITRAKISEGGEVYKPDALFLKFLEVVRANFKKNLTVKQLALLIRTTESKLNELSKLHTGKTAQNVVYGLIASEAKRLFQYEKLSVKETAYELGFSDPFYFSNFFKKQTKLSPKAFREKIIG